jgi:hypothetical protein
MVMVVLTKNIDSYTIYHYQGKDYEAEILRYFDNKNVGAIRFFNDHGAIPKPSVASSGGGFVYLNFPIQRFGDIVDILRHDKPLSIQVEDQNWGILRLFDDPLS